MKLETNIYLRQIGWGCVDEIPVEKFKWTGRWKVKTKVENGPPGYDKKFVTSILSLERRVGFFPFNLFLTTWEKESDFVIRTESTYIGEC